MIGKTLSHYEIVEEIGKGGMGGVVNASSANCQAPFSLSACNIWNLTPVST